MVRIRIYVFPNLRSVVKLRRQKQWNQICWVKNWKVNDHFTEERG